MGDQTWAGDAASLPPAWIEVARHPDFAAAARRLATNMLRLCDEDQRLCAVFKDAGRYMAAMFAAYLHNAGGLTVPLLKQICAGSGFLSPGRARAIIEFLRHLDYLEPEDEAASSARYRPTARFLSAWRRHLQAALDAAALIEPALAPLSARLDRPENFEAFLAIQAARLHALTHEPDPLPVLRRALLHPYAGSQILWVLTLAGGEDAPPASGTVKVSLSDISSRFDVTHLHVRRFLKRAAEEGLIAYHGHGRLSFEPEGARMIELFYAFQLRELVESGQEMLARLPADGAGDAPDKFVRLS